MRKKIGFGLTAVLVVTLCLVMSLFVQTGAQAQQKKVTALEGVKFDTAVSLADNLKTYTGKNVFVHLKSGKTFEGYIKSVGNGLLHLEKLGGGRDFYDALIRIEDITAIEAKFRDMK
jgi:hypothetical protein